MAQAQQTMGQDERKLTALYGMSANFGKTFEKDALRLWMRLLEPYTADEVEFAVLRVIEGYEFKTIPPFAVLRKHLPRSGQEAIADRDEAAQLKAIAEWDHLLADISHYGYYNEPTMMHPTTAYVLRGMGGWSAACQWKESEMPFRKKEFLETFPKVDGNVDLLEGGAAAIERRQAQIALGNGDDRTLKRITKSVVQRLRTQGALEEGESGGR